MPDLNDDQIKKMLAAQEDDLADAERQMVDVTGASGAEFQVMTDDEKSWYEATMEKYLDQYKFENVSDLQDIDRLLGLELLSYRYTNWLIRDTDYDGLSFDEGAVRNHKQKIDQEIRLIKTHMGMGRKHRIESAEQSAAEYLQDVLRRAEEFGIHRNTQVAKAIDLFNDLKTLIGLHDRADEDEASHLGVSTEEILRWVREVAIPEYDEIDNAFRKHQKLWIRDIS